MCGIAGIASFAGPVDGSIVRRMTGRLGHRGPDEEGFHFDDSAGLGVRRLRIIDVMGSHQPVHNEDRTIWAVFNGEIYNFKRVRSELRAHGHEFYTDGDSEVVVHAYEKWGNRCGEHLNGMFAFAVWDERQRRLLLTRDRLGIKPLYYAVDGGTLLFGSEMKSLLAARPEYTLHEIDPFALRAFLSFGYVPSPFTMFSGARCLPPGHRLAFSIAAPPRLEAYWDVPQHGTSGLIDDERHAIREFRDLLGDVVSDQMVSDVPIGAFLSGGLDSTAVVSRMARSSATPIKTFSVGFAEDSYDERPWARRVAKKVGTLHHEEVITPEQVGAEIVDIIGIFDEPFADSSAIPLHFLARMTRDRGVTVVLTGDGGDELFGGYETYLADRLLGTYQRFPAALRALAKRAVGLLPVSHRKVGPEQKLKRFLAFGESPPLEAHALWRSLFFADELPRVLADGLCGDFTARDAAGLLLGDLDRLPDPTDGINAFCYLDTKFYLPADMLVKVDRVTMAHSLEARVPLLDERLVDFAFRLSPRLKWRGRTGKILMRRALRGDIDPDILSRPKAGFNVPMPVWIAGPLRELFRDVLSPTAVGRAGFFRPAYVERLFAEHAARQAEHSFRLYALLAFHLWLDRWGPLGAR